MIHAATPTSPTTRSRCARQPQGLDVSFASARFKPVTCGFLVELRDSNPCLDQANAVLAAVSFRLIPIRRSRSLTAVALSCRDGVKSGRRGDGSPGALREKAHAVESDDDRGSFVSRHAEWQR
ncbi:MAG: hypothetical protein QOI79_2254 [Mycobacterium sp.]|jgi:hypothetical protein|nr:hypothetical protein [Mycobacterium sp.]